MKHPLAVQIEGTVYAQNGDDLGQNEFLDAFIEFIESKGLSFGGGCIQIDEQGKKINNTD